jgi:hypothetical protein
VIEIHQKALLPAGTKLGWIIVPLHPDIHRLMRLQRLGASAQGDAPQPHRAPSLWVALQRGRGHGQHHAPSVAVVFIGGHLSDVQAVNLQLIKPARIAAGMRGISRNGQCAALR